MAAARTARVTRPVSPQTAAETRTRVNIEALEQRVYGTERKVDDLSAQTSNQFRAFREDMMGAISALSSKIDSQQRDAIEAQRSASAQALEAQRAAAASSKTQWVPIIIMMMTAVGVTVGALGTIGSLAMAPITRDISRLEDDNKRQDADKYSIAAQVEFEKRLDNRLSQGKDDNTARLAAIDHRIDTLAADQVSRAEHQAHWTEYTSRLDALSARINEATKEFGGNFTLGDVVKELQRQISELRTQAPPPALPAAH